MYYRSEYVHMLDERHRRAQGRLTPIPGEDWEALVLAMHFEHYPPLPPRQTGNRLMCASRECRSSPCCSALLLIRVPRGGEDTNAHGDRNKEKSKKKKQKKQKSPKTKKKSTTTTLINSREDLFFVF
jgi:hypothetical protein